MKQLLAVLIVLFIAQPIVAGEWYPVIIHVHTIFSDGGKTPQQVAEIIMNALAKARPDGKCVVIVCDHFDGVARFFEKYAEAIRNASGGKVIMIPGLELGSKWRPEPNTEAVSHLLAIGELPANYRTLLECYDLNTSGEGLPLLDRFDMQQKLIEKVLALGMLPVAAHPTQLVIGGSVLRTDNRFDMNANYKGIRAVEEFNVLGPGQSAEAVSFFLKLIAAGLQVFVTAGSDYHGTTASAVPEGLTDPLDRITWVYAEDFSEKSILKAISEGRTYAASHGAYFRDFLIESGQNPSLVPTGVDKMLITAMASVEGRATKILIHRDGIEVARQEFKNRSDARTTYSFNGGDSFKTGWTDPDAIPGSVHSYVVQVLTTTRFGEETVLITSPITLRLRLPGQTIAFFDAIRAGDLAGIESALAVDPSLANSRDGRDIYNFAVHSGNPLALSVACAVGSDVTVECLLKHGATPDSYVYAGEPGPLMEAACIGSVTKARMLLNKGANINIRTDGNTPLVRALGGRFVELAKFLIERGANPNLTNDNGQTALAVARNNNLSEIVEILVAKGAKE